MNNKYFIYLICKIATVSVIAIVLAACKSNTIIDEYREVAKTYLGADEAIVVLGRRHSSDHETEIDFISCIGASLSSGKNAMNIIPEDEFVNSMYPYFETSTAPMDVKNLDRLVQNPAIAEKFTDFHIRYFIWIDGFTERTDSSGSVSCAIGPGGGGCFGFATWDDEANYEAKIWDFKNLELSGKINAETKGTSYMPAIIIPIPMLARVQANACKSMANQIKTFIQ